MSSYKNKTLPQKQERNEEISEASGGIVDIPVVVEPVVVPVPLAIVGVPIEVQRVPVAVRAAQNCAKYLLYHHPLNTLGVESHSASQCLNTLHQVSSFFEVSSYTTLSQTSG